MPLSSPKIGGVSSPGIVLIIAVLLVGLLIPLFLMGTIFRQPELGSGVVNTMTVDAEFERGYLQHLVVAKFDQEVVDAKRGEVVTVAFTLKHRSHSFWQWVTVKDFEQGVKNYYRASYIDVTIDDISPDSIVLLPNTSASGQMTFSINATASDEIVGKSVNLVLNFAADPAFGGSAASQGAGITIQVTG